MEEFSGQRWERLVTVEIWAEFGFGKLDWEFCVDDLKVGFEAVEEGDAKVGNHAWEVSDLL